MAKRQIPEINAGSMADIAFLLLIFFLVTTTMDVDQGISAVLPQKIENQSPIVIKKRNILVVKANKFDMLMVNGEETPLEGLYQKTREFYVHAENEELPSLITITPGLAKEKVLTFKSWHEQRPEIQAYKDSLEEWTERYRAVEIFGAYQELPKNAIISFQNDNATSYEVYVAVRNELERAINDMRNELTLRAWNIKFQDLDPDKLEEKEKIKIVRRVIPQRVAERAPTKNAEE
jgi:biopolymer transport protein ExbD